jgi:cobaltochelatase CobT
MHCDVFMSYTHVKDLFGVVGTFREHLENELRQKTGNAQLVVFQDTRGIHGGDKWEQILTAELHSAKLLLVLLSPTWIRSEWCRREYRLFTRGGTGARQDRPVVPLLWDEVSDAHALTLEERDVLSELKGYQMLRWEELRYEDWSSPAPNSAAGKLAKELGLKLPGV